VPELISSAIFPVPVYEVPFEYDPLHTGIEPKQSWLFGCAKLILAIAISNKNK
jgi:hypothetical protein